MTPGRSVIIWIAAARLLMGSAREPIYVGVLEALPERARRESQQAQQFHVRVAFRFQDGRWTAMPNDADDQDALAKLPAKFPSQVSWTIALENKKLGEVSSVRPLEYPYYSDAGFEDLTEGSEPPRVQEDAAAFATWMGAPKYRPLLAVSEPHYDDPDKWTAFDAPPAMRQQAAAAFRRAVKPDAPCDGGTPRSYPDSAIQIYGKTYQSKHGDVLIAMRPDPRIYRCDEGPWGEERQSVWFHLKGDSSRWIGNSLTLLDIGDYNADGAAKILFQYDGYNKDGYVLFDPRDDSKTEFSWFYH
jgi:hypothetical protein